MELGLAGKHAFIAGASRGIGLAIAEAFLKEGGTVSMTARGAEALEAAVAALVKKYGSGRIFHVAADMLQTPAIINALEGAEAKLGPIHTVVGNIGGVERAQPGWDVDDDVFDFGITQNFFGSYRLAREAVRRALARPREDREGFNIIFISSGGGVQAVKTPLTYGGSKSLLNHVTKELSKFLGPEGIRVNALLPAMTVFPGNGWEERLQSDQRDYWIDYNKRETALQRFGTPEEAADVAVFIASPRAGIMTGAIVAADAGQLK